MTEYELKYYECLSEKFKNKKQVLAEIINLKAIMNLPKGTEHFVSDIHGEYEMFLHILKTASGVIKRKIDEELEDTLSASDRASLACLIYYPEEKLALIEKSDDWFRVMLYRLIRVAKCVSAKYTRSKVRKMLPKNFAYIIDELLNCDSESINKENYYKGIIENIIRFGLAEDFLKALCSLIQSLAIDHLHIVGDIFDRGPRADIILDYLKGVRSLDIQWGNHDILWIGAGLGDPACILSALCDCFKYNNLDLLEDGYSINLLPLFNFANKYYKHSDITAFKTKYNNENLARLLKAVSIMRFKVEDSYKSKYKSFNMQDLTVLDKIDFDKKSWSGYPMKECDFPTINKDNPTELNKDEQEVLNKLIHSFVTSSKLKSHIKFLLDKGALYLCYNNNLMFHGCIPLDDNGKFLPMEYDGKYYKGKEYMDFCDRKVRQAFITKNADDIAFIWGLWCGNKSPVFGKDKMTTFERIYIEDKATHEEFGLDKTTAHIINGHIPVKQTKGESPIKAKGKMIVIDGGMSKPYQKVTGIAGYTLTYHSYGMGLASHEPFLGKEEIVSKDREMLTVKYVVSRYNDRITVGQTDIGKKLTEQIIDLEALAQLYTEGIIKER